MMSSTDPWTLSESQWTVCSLLSAAVASQHICFSVHWTHLRKQTLQKQLCEVENVKLTAPSTGQWWVGLNPDSDVNYNRSSSSSGTFTSLCSTVLCITKMQHQPHSRSENQGQKWPGTDEFPTGLDLTQQKHTFQIWLHTMNGWSVVAVVNCNILFLKCNITFNLLWSLRTGKHCFNDNRYIKNAI